MLDLLNIFKILVCKSKDYTLIPLVSCILVLLCSLSWLIYGILPVFDISVVVPNVLGIKINSKNYILGVILSVTNICLYTFFFLNRTNRRDVDVF